MPATIKINPERTELVCELDGEVICHKEGFAPGDLDGGIIVMDDTHIFVIADAFGALHVCSYGSDAFPRSRK